MAKTIIQNKVSLAPYTSFGVGGDAEYFSLVTNSEELKEALLCTLPDTQLWTIGFGSNCLISDAGLRGMTLCIRGGDISVDYNSKLIIADAGAWWDDVVQAAIENGLWGVEFMSEIPGSVGASAFINITAYGQSLGSVVEWIEVWNRKTSQIVKLYPGTLVWGYKSSIFQGEAGKDMIVLRVCLRLSDTKTDDLTYEKALDVATEKNLDTEKLQDRRDIIIEARRRAGSLWQPDRKNVARTAGSFFKNTLVPSAVAEQIISFDESGKSLAEIKHMNQVHAGDTKKISAAHILLAAGFKRGQQWGNVKLNDQNLLKVEALAGATAQDVYDVMLHIQKTVKEKLNIELEPEVRLLGKF